MSARKPLVNVGGEITELPAGDTLDASANEVDVVTMSNANAAPITKGMAGYHQGAGAVDLARANASGTKKVLGLVRAASIAAAATGSIQTNGILSSSDWTDVVGGASLTAGAQYYLSSTTAGQLTTTAPSSAGTFVAPVGVALNNTDLQINISPLTIEKT